MASIITAAISYLALLEENCPVYNGLKIQQESGWEELEEGINLLVDLWLQNNSNQMNKMTIMGIWFLSLLINSGCNRDLVEYDSNDLKISIEKGKSGCIIFLCF